MSFSNCKLKIAIKKLSFLLAFVLVFCAVAGISPLPSHAAELVIVLDPGHGGSDPGAENTVDGKLYQEKTLNLKISQAAKAYLDKFSGVKVVMTRNDDNTYLTLGQRVSFANKQGAHALVSIHNNSSGESSAGGALIIVADNDFRPDLSKQTQDMSRKILSHMCSLGLRDRGLMTLMANSGSYVVYYPDGSPQDYYGIVQRSIRAGIPGIIIESAFISSPDDVRKYLSSDEKLSALGTAIGKGIAEYYGLSEGSTFDTAYRSPINAEKLDFTLSHHADLVYAFGDSKKTYNKENGVTLSSSSSAPTAYLDYMGMTLQTSEYSAAVITAKASYDGAKMSVYYGADEVYTINSDYCYSTTLSTDYRHYVIDFSGSPIWDLGVNFLQLNVKGAESLSLKNIEFFSSVSSIPYSDTVSVNKGGGAIQTSTPAPTSTPKPTSTPAPTATPAPTSTPEPTKAPTEKPTEVPTNPPTTEPTTAPSETNISETLPSNTETTPKEESTAIVENNYGTQGSRAALIVALVCTIALAIAILIALIVIERRK